VRIVVADTSPIRYLVVIGEIEILPALFGTVIIPTIVRDELVHPRAPEAVRTWMQAPPLWLEPRVTPASPFDGALENLDEGEKAALVLAASLSAELILLDDREGARVALEKGFGVMGTLRVLHLAAKQRLLDWTDAIERLKRTNFRYQQAVIDRLLDEPLDE
jgi:predicted nucleic acid-binding protein